MSSISNTSSIPVNGILIDRLSFTELPQTKSYIGEAFYRYPWKYRELEDHMKRHIEAGKGDYLILNVGACCGKEPISTIISWLEVAGKVDPTYKDKVALVAVDQNAEAMKRFMMNMFSINLSSDKELDIVQKYWIVRSSDLHVLFPDLAVLTDPRVHISFPPDITEKIHYVCMNAESYDMELLPKVFGIDYFDAIICHTTSRYFRNEKKSMERILSLLKEDGFLSYIR